MTRHRLAVALLAALLAARCSTSSERPRSNRPDANTTIVMVPGMTGSRLCERSTGRLFWGDATTLLKPWDGGYRLAAPLSGAEDDLVPCGAIREIRIQQWRKDIYGGLIAFMERSGYPHDQSFFLFDHDWRRDNVTNARRLAATLERMAAARDDRRFTLICQSNAAYICRWLVKYGDVSIEDAEAGLRRPPAGVRIEKVIFIGTANGGALRILNELNRGRQYIRLIGRRWRPETSFTFPSLFQDLPVYRADLFVDERGQAMAIDLFDPSTWQTYGWSIFAPEVEERLERTDRFGTAEDRRAYLSRVLGNARRMHELLGRDAGGSLPRYYSIQSVDFLTPSRAVIRRRRRGWETLLRSEARGDRHATKESQHWFSSEELRALAESPLYVNGGHFEMITTERTRQELLRIILGSGRDSN